MNFKGSSVQLSDPQWDYQDRLQIRGQGFSAQQVGAPQSTVSISSTINF